MCGLVGAKEVVSRLAAPISTVRTSTAVVSVEPKAGSVEITYRKVDDASEAVAKEVFQHVIIATQGTVMLYLWPSPAVASPALCPFLANMVPKVLRGVDKALLSALSNIPHQVRLHTAGRATAKSLKAVLCFASPSGWPCRHPQR